MPGSEFPWLAAVLIGLGGYLLGSVSFAWLLARMKGVDLRSIGSGNLGATNTGRALGRKLGLVVYLLDALKGAVPALVGLVVAPDHPEVAIAGGASAILGHVFPIWFGFRGGKGVATLSGAFLVIAPLAFLLVAASFVLVVWSTRFMSMGSLGLGLLLGPATYAVGAMGWRRPPHADSVIIFGFAAGLFVIFTHRSNIGRLLSGTENRLKIRTKRSHDE